MLIINGKVPLALEKQLNSGEGDGSTIQSINGLRPRQFLLTLKIHVWVDLGLKHESIIFAFNYNCPSTTLAKCPKKYRILVILDEYLLTLTNDPKKGYNCCFPFLKDEESGAQRCQVTPYRIIWLQTQIESMTAGSEIIKSGNIASQTLLLLHGEGGRGEGHGDLYHFSQEG